MILFTKEYIAPILSGEKQSTDRLWHRCPIKVGSTHFAANGYSADRRFARLKITKVEERRVGDFTEADAKARGYTDRADMIRTWDTLNHKDSNRYNRVFTIHFVLVENLTRETTLPLFQPKENQS